MKRQHKKPTLVMVSSTQDTLMDHWKLSKNKDQPVNTLPTTGQQLKGYLKHWKLNSHNTSTEQQSQQQPHQQQEQEQEQQQQQQHSQHIEQSHTQTHQYIEPSPHIQNTHTEQSYTPPPSPDTHPYFQQRTHSLTDTHPTEHPYTNQHTHTQRHTEFVDNSNFINKQHTHNILMPQQRQLLHQHPYLPQHFQQTDEPHAHNNVNIGSSEHASSIHLLVNSNDVPIVDSGGVFHFEGNDACSSSAVDEVFIENDSSTNRTDSDVRMEVYETPPHLRRHDVSPDFYRKNSAFSSSPRKIPPAFLQCEENTPPPTAFHSYRTSPDGSGISPLNRTRNTSPGVSPSPSLLPSCRTLEAASPDIHSVCSATSHRHSITPPVGTQQEIEGAARMLGIPQSVSARTLQFLYASNTKNTTVKRNPFDGMEGAVVPITQQRHRRSAFGGLQVTSGRRNTRSSGEEESIDG